MPRKSKPRSKKIVVDHKKNWSTILKHVDKKEVPLELLYSINVTLIDGTNINIDIPSLLDSHKDPIEVEEYLNDKFAELDEYIENVDFFINVDSVSKTVEESTNQLFKNL